MCRLGYVDWNILCDGHLLKKVVAKEEWWSKIESRGWVEKTETRNGRRSKQQVFWALPTVLTLSTVWSLSTVWTLSTVWSLSMFSYWTKNTAFQKLEWSPSSEECRGTHWVGPDSMGLFCGNGQNWMLQMDGQTVDKREDKIEKGRVKERLTRNIWMMVKAYRPPKTSTVNFRVYIAEHSRRLSILILYTCPFLDHSIDRFQNVSITILYIHYLFLASAQNYVLRNTTQQVNIALKF